MCRVVLARDLQYRGSVLVIAHYSEIMTRPHSVTRLCSAEYYLDCASHYPTVTNCSRARSEYKHSPIRQLTFKEFIRLIKKPSERRWKLRVRTREIEEYNYPYDVVSSTTASISKRGFASFHLPNERRKRRVIFQQSTALRFYAFHKGCFHVRELLCVDLIYLNSLEL